MTTQAVRVVARHEFRMRIRAGRWRWLLGGWLVLTTGLTALLWAASSTAANRATDRGALLFDALALFVLLVGVLVAPALAAQSVNGDRERGVLATLQVTLLTPGELALGKLVAAWGTALVFLALTLPAVLLCALAGGVQPVRVVVAFATLALLLGVICAIALALSALLRRTVTSSLVAYLAVALLCLGTLIAFGIATALDTHRVHVRYTEPGASSCAVAPGTVTPSCSSQDSVVEEDETHSRTDRSWIWLAPNPFVVLADAAPHTQRQRDGSIDVLGALGRDVRRLRSPDPVGEVVFGTTPSGDRPVWPWGLGIDLLVGAGAVALTARRLRTPARSLPRGARVA